MLVIVIALLLVGLGYAISIAPTARDVTVAIVFVVRAALRGRRGNHHEGDSSAHLLPDRRRDRGSDDRHWLGQQQAQAVGRARAS